MASAQYEIYINNVFSLARTLVIKCTAVADAINANLDDLFAKSGGDPRYAVNPALPATWKYYLNLSGQYHASDTMMTVISQDTLQTINFTTDNLKYHIATAQAYQPGGRYFNDLMARYPTQEMLARGILNPVNINTAIAADNGQVLWWDPTLVESNEMDLIADLTRYAQNYFHRWYVAAYGNTDDLYVAAMLGVMYANLPNVILNTRLKYCKTYQAHSFHIREYLAGAGRLDEFVDSLTKEQLLWLYRNIDYIQRNPGTQETFESLVEHILTARNIPLSGWQMRHDLTDLETSLLPTPEFVRENINFVLSDSAADTRSVEAMLEAEIPLARDNDARPDTVAEVTSLMANSLSDNLNTKVLESDMLDLTDAAPYTLSDCLVNHWLYFATLGRYNAVVTVDNPKTGDTYTFSSADAFVVFVYAWTLGQGLPLDTIPMWWANKVMKLTAPTDQELLQLVDPRVIDQEDLDASRLHQPILQRTYISIQSFNTAVRAIHDFELFQHQLFSTQGHLWKRAYLETITLDYWVDYKCDLGAGQNYLAWFQERGLDVPTLDQAQLATLANEILAEATGQNLAVVESLADLQSAMLRLMARLSSYSIQFLASINTSPVKVIERPSIRLGDTLADAQDDTKVTIPMGDLMHPRGAGKHLFTGTMITDVSIYDQEVSGVDKSEVTLLVGPIGGTDVVGKEWIPLPMAEVRRVTDNLDYTLIDTNPTVSSQYQPLGLMALPEAFTNLNYVLYPLTSADQTGLQAQYMAWAAANNMPTSDP